MNDSAWQPGPRAGLGAVAARGARAATRSGSTPTSCSTKRCGARASRDFGGDAVPRALPHPRARARRARRSSTRSAARSRAATASNWLENRLQLADTRKRHPEIAAAPVERPIFITGLPRTGTSILHELLAQDPAHRAPLHWEVRSPCPPPETRELRDRSAHRARRARRSSSGTRSCPSTRDARARRAHPGRVRAAHRARVPERRAAGPLPGAELRGLVRDAPTCARPIASTARCSSTCSGAAGASAGC